MNMKIIWKATESHGNQRNDTLPGMKTQKKKNHCDKTKIKMFSSIECSVLSSKD